MSLSAAARRLTIPRVDHEWMKTGALAVPLILVLAVVTIAVSVRPARSTELVLIAVVLGLFTLVVGHVRQILLVLVIFDISLQWDVNVGYQTAAAKYGAFAGLNISATTMALFLLYGMFLADRFAHLGTVRLRFAPARPLMVYIGVLVLSVGVAHDRALSIYQIAMFVQTLLLFVYLASTVRTSGDVRL